MNFEEKRNQMIERQIYVYEKKKQGWEIPINPKDTQPKPGSTNNREKGKQEPNQENGYRKF